MICKINYMEYLWQTSIPLPVYLPVHSPVFLSLTIEYVAPPSSKKIIKHCGDTENACMIFSNKICIEPVLIL